MFLIHCNLLLLLRALFSSSHYIDKKREARWLSNTPKVAQTERGRAGIQSPLRSLTSRV